MSLFNKIDREADALVSHYGLTAAAYHDAPVNGPEDHAMAEAFSDLLDAFPEVDAPVLSERLAAAILCR